MFLTFREHVKKLLTEALGQCEYPSSDLALTVKPGYADLTSLIAFKLAPVLKLAPQEIARNVTQHLGSDELVARVRSFRTLREFLCKRRLPAPHAQRRA